MLLSTVGTHTLLTVYHLTFSQPELSTSCKRTIRELFLETVAPGSLWHQDHCGTRITVAPGSLWHQDHCGTRITVAPGSLWHQDHCGTRITVAPGSLWHQDHCGTRITVIIEYRSSHCEIVVIGGCAGPSRQASMYSRLNVCICKFRHIHKFQVTNFLTIFTEKTAAG